MKSTQRLPKPPKQSNDQSPSDDSSVVDNESLSQASTEHQPDPAPINNETISPRPVEAQQPTRPNNQELEQKPKIKLQQSNERRYEHTESPPDHFQHIKFLDCDKSVNRVLFECWHCKQGIISEYSGEPAIGEFKGRPSVILVKVKCPTCEQTAIRLSAKKVISTTAIPSPWGL
jgi:hypothetical protein